MAEYNNQTSAVNVNSLFLQFYLDLQKELTKTFESRDIDQFNLYVYYLRSCITRRDVRHQIDVAMKRREEELKNNAEISDSVKRFIVGFTVIEECMSYLDHALHITEFDVGLPLDTTDTNIKVQLDKLTLYKLASKIKSNEKKESIEARILTNDISSVDQLIAEIGDDQ